MHFIYAILDPRDEQPFYIGITDQPETRFARHLFDRQATNKEKTERIQAILAEGLMPIFLIFEKWEDKKQAGKREKYLIQFYESKGYSLTNIDFTDKVTSPRLKAGVLRRGKVKKSELPTRSSLYPPQDGSF